MNLSITSARRRVQSPMCFAPDKTLVTFVSETALSSLDPSDRAAALECFIRGWPDHPGLEAALQSADHTQHILLQVIAAYGRVCLGKRRDEDLSLLVSLVELRGNDPWTSGGTISSRKGSFADGKMMLDSKRSY